MVFLNTADVVIFDLQDSVLDHLTMSVAKMQTHFQTLCRLRDALDQVYKQRETTES